MASSAPHRLAPGPRDDRSSSPGRTRFGLGELVDLEYLLEREDGLSLETRNERDRALARELASDLADPGRNPARDRKVLRAWLERHPSRDDARSLGRWIAELVSLTRVGLWSIGGLLGAVTIGGWLLQGTGTPINVAVFWPAVIGVQLIFLLGLAALALLAPLARSSALASAMTRVLSAVGAALPWLGLRLLARIGARDPDETRQRVSELRRIDRLYRPIRIYLMATLTQGFAVGFNLGALLAFVAIPTLDDPAFGWRSRLLDDSAIHTTTRILAAPWRTWLPDAVPSPEAIAASRYSSIAARYDTPPSRAPDPGASASSDESAAQTPGRDTWAIWWPFLFASLCFYALLPRVLVYAAARMALRRSLRRAPIRHAASGQLIDRLTRLAIDSRAMVAEADAERAREEPLREGDPSRGLPLCLLCWDGVPEPTSALVARYQASGHTIVSAHRVGGLDPELDRAALRALADLDPRALQVGLVVEAWEPPTGDYLDFVSSLRTVLGDDVPIHVVLYLDSKTADADSAQDPAFVHQWRSALRSLADPWLLLGQAPRAST